MEKIKDLTPEESRKLIKKSIQAKTEGTKLILQENNQLRGAERWTLRELGLMDQ